MNVGILQCHRCSLLYWSWLPWGLFLFQPYRVPFLFLVSNTSLAVTLFSVTFKCLRIDSNLFIPSRNFASSSWFWGYKRYQINLKLNPQCLEFKSSANMHILIFMMHLKIATPVLILRWVQRTILGVIHIHGKSRVMNSSTRNGKIEGLLFLTIKYLGLKKTPKGNVEGDDSVSGLSVKSIKFVSCIVVLLSKKALWDRLTFICATGTILCSLLSDRKQK